MHAPEHEDYDLFRRRLQQAEDEATRWQTHALALVRSQPGARRAARMDLVTAGLIAEPKHETCRERRDRLEQANRKWRRIETQKA